MVLLVCDTVRHSFHRVASQNNQNHPSQDLQFRGWTGSWWAAGSGPAARQRTGWRGCGSAGCGWCWQTWQEAGTRERSSVLRGTNVSMLYPQAFNLAFGFGGVTTGSFELSFHNGVASDRRQQKDWFAHDMSKLMTSDRILTKGLILRGLCCQGGQTHTSQKAHGTWQHSVHTVLEFLGLFCWYLPVWEIRECEKTLVPILTDTKIISEHRNCISIHRWAVPILTGTWLWLQHHLNISLLAFQKPAGNLTRTGFPGSLLTSCFCSHPEIGSKKQKHWSEHLRPFV